ncbi:MULTISPECIES: zinc-binding dehydrogenase [unclassified Nonomuraea]|uniref:zinc-binding dehydrogenase n=1 Tax=unclassified Nonomuraea TaxID=2593643 RepID=UPI0033E61323
MRALVVGPGAVGRLADVPEPVPGAGQALVEVRRTSVNFSELRHMDRLPEGVVLGYDAAGVVLRPAADGTGPAEGARVAAFGAGAWAERAAFDTGSLAVVPDGVDLAVAAALPMSGLSALRSLRAAGVSLGSRVLVTGASGSVGRLAVQLARLAGAHVVASVSSPARALALGPDVHVVTGLDGVAPVDVVIELVGGPTLVTAWGLLKPGGNLQSIGWAGGQPAVFPPGSTFSLGPARSMRSFGDVDSPGPDLAFLLGLVAAGDLSVEIGRRVPWERLDEAAAAQLDRTVTGKVVLDIGPAGHGLS